VLCAACFLLYALCFSFVLRLDPIFVVSFLFYRLVHDSCFFFVYVLSYDLSFSLVLVMFH
jgi:hypothetical protein